MDRSHAVTRPTISERLLGAFVCFQLLAIPLGSYIKLVPVRATEQRGELKGDLQEKLPPDRWATAREPMQTMFDAIAWVSSRWGEVSGQAQCWALFASFGQHAAMPAVELHWPAEAQREPVTLRCHFEPADPTRYFFPPEPACRRYNFEYRTVIFYWIAVPDDFSSPEKYRRRVLNNVHDMRRSMSAFLRWRTDKYLQEHPGTPTPERVVLQARILPNPKPGDSRLNRPSAYNIPVAQWRPGGSNESAVDAWDPLQKQFVAVDKGGGP
jgi:hypothetical protein